jgi:hypothetical protein
MTRAHALLRTVACLPLVGMAVATAGCGAAAQSAAQAGQHTSPMDYEFTFREVHPSGAPTYFVRVFMAARGGKLQRFYSVTALPSGAPAFEAVWSATDPTHEMIRDWRSCTQSESTPPEKVPTTVSAMEATMLGPLRPPRNAVWVSPHTWRISQGVAILTVQTFGPKITDRIVSVGVPTARTPGTIIEGASLVLASHVPSVRAGWQACRATQSQ